jgi:hypothetical protein
MAVATRIETLAAVAKLANTPANLSLACRDFLDGFYEAPAVSKLEAEPTDLAGILKDGGQANAYLAALAEYVARTHGLTVPRWSLDPSRVAIQPLFAMESYEARMFLLLESPPEFRARNIFISADALTRA